MRTLLAALTGLTSLATLAAAQPLQTTPDTVPAGQANAKAGIAECDRLVAYLEEVPGARESVSLEQARAWRRSLDAGACQSSFHRLTGEAAPGRAAAGGAVTAAEATAGQVVVQQPQPTVTVRQKQPEVIVRIPPPVITVQQPQPEIIVRVPEPDVNVAMPRPDVEVKTPQAQVQVVPPAAPEGPAQGQSGVRIERTGEPKIIYQPAEGPPLVRYEGAAAAPAGGARAAAEPAQTSALPTEIRAVAVDDLEEMPVFNGRGEKLGEIDEVLRGADGAAYLLISHGGFLGLGEKKVALPSDQFVFRGDRLTAESLTDEQIKALPEFKESRNFTRMKGEEAAQLRALR
jgi:hypothetical protein